MSPFGPQNVLMIEVVPTRAPLLFLICIFGFEYFIENLHFICMFYFSLNLCLEAHNIPWGILPLKLSKSLVGTFIRIIIRQIKEQLCKEYHMPSNGKTSCPG